MLKPLCLSMLCVLGSAVSPAAKATPATSQTPYTAPTLKLEPIAFKLRDGSTIAAEQGSFEVPEYRRDTRSRKITIKFARFKSTSAHPGPPIIYLAGGPGGSGIDAARGPRQPIFLSLRSVGDVIALDQRGTGLSNAIPACTAAVPLDPGRGINEASLTEYYRRTLTSCLETWRTAGVLTAGYNTVESADDLESLRRALAVPKIQLWGISYGTHLALATMRRHPAIIDRVVLASAEGMNQTVKLPNAVDAALGRIARVLNDDLTATMRRVHERLDRTPASLSVDGPAGPIRFKMDSFALRMLAGAIAKNPDGIANLAGIYTAFDAGQEQALAPMLYGMFYKDRLVMTGMPELMDLASGVNGSRLKEVRLQARTALAGDATNFPMPQLVGVTPELDLGDSYRREVRSAIPTLLFSGDLDARTPLEEQAVATAGLGRLTTIVVRNGGHDLFEAHPAIAGLIVTFLKGAPVAQKSLRLDPPEPSRSK